MKKFLVSYSGATIVEAENADQACEIAMSEMQLDEIDAYEMDKNGNIIKNNIILQEVYYGKITQRTEILCN